MSGTRWRRTWWQVHKWIGLLLVVVIVPVSLTGAVLVWHEPLQRALDPARYATSGATLLPVARYAAAAQARAVDGGRVASVVLPEPGSRDPVAVTIQPPDPAARTGPGGPPRRTTIFLDPPTARILSTGDDRGGVLRIMHRLHGSLMIPGAGRTIVGWIGVAMLLSSATGLWLWWPLSGRWTRGLRWRRRRHTEANLHYVAGFWVAVPLFMLSLTGAWISFPRFFGALTGEAPRGAGAAGRAMRAPPLARPRLSPDTVVALARPLAGGAAARTVIWPTGRRSDWTVSYATQPMRTITVADDSGVAAPARDDGPRVARLMRRLHDGTGMGLAWQAAIFLAGLAPALLGVTGVIIWWRARRATAERARRVAKRRAAAASPRE
jgi:uncharacterized iron-regulated membrane protein